MNSVVLDQWCLLSLMNLVVGVIDGFRGCLLGEPATLYLPTFLLSSAVVTFFLWPEVSTFRSTQKTFADLV